MDFLRLDAHDQLEALNAGRISALDALNLAIARADAVGGTLNAVVARRLDLARDEARRIDEARSLGEPMGRLAGLPMTIKDSLDIEGLPASVGRASHLDRRSRDADSVRRVRAEGAIVWGQTNTPIDAADWQTFNPLYGVTNNPWNLKRTPGGSSGGSAAALAAGISALEIGADTISQAGLAPPQTLDLDMAVVGPMARSARDLELLFSILSQRPFTPAPPKDLANVRIGLWLDEPGFELDPGMRRVIERFAKQLQDHGAIVEPASGPVSGGETLEIYTGLLYPLLWAKAPAAEMALYEALRGPAKLARRLGAGPLSWAQGVLAATARYRDWRATEERRAARIEAIDTFFTRFDVLLAPCAPTPAFEHDHGPRPTRKLKLSTGRRIDYLQLMSWPALATVWGLPATAIPVGLTDDGLPVGVQLIGPRDGDARTLGVARAIEERLGAFPAPPPLS
ncbi:MAG: amidase [Caulobacter sp. 12-67-6]|nr:MAG: amidase [Caulobacter sp. 12-67-6]